MSRYFESEQDFLQRLTELKLDDLKEKFIALGWHSVAVLAFASYVPGQPTPSATLSTSASSTRRNTT